MRTCASEVGAQGLDVVLERNSGECGAPRGQYNGRDNSLITVERRVELEVGESLGDFPSLGVIFAMPFAF